MRKIKIYAEDLDDKTLEQFNSAMRQPYVIKGALMPDAHLGYSLPIGGVVATKEAIVPSWVGYDIGCGVCALKTPFVRGELTVPSSKIFEKIYENIPIGLGGKQAGFTTWKKAEDIKKTSFLSEVIEKNSLLNQLGTLGSGNHFIEIGYDENNKVWISVHSGSRALGHKIASHYIAMAHPQGLVKEGHYPLYAGSVAGDNYIEDMNFCLAFALENRKRMVEAVLDILLSTGVGGWNKDETEEWLAKDSLFDEGSGFINRNHNHIEHHKGLWIHRKGATQAYKGVRGVVPGNMRDGLFIVIGKGSPMSLNSSSHGAGRIKSRTQAKKDLSMSDFSLDMLGVTAKVSEYTIDESPRAYKDIYRVMELQDKLIEIEHHVKPVINIKAEDKRRRKFKK